jgi:hypothetical protein
MQHAYLLGYRRAFSHYRRDLREMAARFDDCLADLQHDYKSLERELRSEQHRSTAIERALAAQPGPDDIWLN